MVLQDSTGAPVFALTPAGYEALAFTLVDTVRWVQEAAAQLRYYRESTGAPQLAPDRSESSGQVQTKPPP